MLQIQVFMTKQAMLSEKPVFERLVAWDSSVRFPVDETITTMRAIYSPKAVIDIKFFGEE